MLQGKEEKSEREVYLLFWLEICSIIGAYFIPILVLKFQLKISEKASAKIVEASFMMMNQVDSSSFDDDKKPKE